MVKCFGIRIVFKHFIFHRFGTFITISIFIYIFSCFIQHIESISVCNFIRSLSYRIINHINIFIFMKNSYMRCFKIFLSFSNWYRFNVNFLVSIIFSNPFDICTFSSPHYRTNSFSVYSIKNYFSN